MEPKCLQHPTDSKLRQGCSYGIGGHVVTIWAAGDDGETWNQEKGGLNIVIFGKLKLGLLKEAPLLKLAAAPKSGLYRPSQARDV